MVSKKCRRHAWFICGNDWEQCYECGVYRMRKPHKYRAKQTTVDGISFPSKAQAKRYQELKWLEKAGEIRELQLEPSFPLRIGSVLVCHYRGDFSYNEKSSNWRRIVEDVKGYKTPVYRLKKKLMKALHGIEIRETS